MSCRYSTNELRRLHDAAVSYCSSSSMVPCNWLYRNKDNAYFESIEASDGVMKTELKDNGGDPRSPINGCLRGLFFLANNISGNPPPYSYFGPRRIKIKAEEMSRLAPNLYFADFYCMGGVRHYVILVMTTNNLANLIRLDKANNPFLRTENDGHLYTPDTERFDVEVFFTENLYMNELLSSGKAVMETVEIRGQGHSTRGGKKKMNLAVHVIQ